MEIQLLKAGRVAENSTNVGHPEEARRGVGRQQAVSGWVLTRCIVFGRRAMGRRALVSRSKTGDVEEQQQNDGDGGTGGDGLLDVRSSGRAAQACSRRRVDPQSVPVEGEDPNLGTNAGIESIVICEIH